MPINILAAQGLSKSFGLKRLFEGVTLGLDERDRVGVIGINGSGKSTLLRVLAGLEPPDSGELATRHDLRVVYLPQLPDFDPELSVIEHIFAAQGEQGALLRDYEAASRRLAAQPEDEATLRALGDLTRRLDAAGAWGRETRAKTILTRLGIEDFDARLGTLSGGYRKRVALAHALVAEPELLLLDEPTNHLDADTVAWLEDWLQRFGGAVIAVTHDRYFLDRVTRRIIEIERGELRLFDGNFSYYLEKKAEVEAAFSAAEVRRRAILKQELAWFRRGARARRTKQKARIQQLAELQSQDFTRPREQLRFAAATRRLGRKILDVHDLSKSIGGRPLIERFSYSFTRGERLGIIGPNGCGKTTLANLLAGRLDPDAGSIEVGETVRFGIYDQESAGLDPRERAIDYVRREGGENLRTADGAVLAAAVVMERFLFTPQMLYAPIEKLSGGERRRLYLVRTLMGDPNFLILDEPANDLDLMTLAALEDFLDGFGGCLLVISHDRYFLDRTVDRVLAFEGGGRLRLYPGAYSVCAEIRAAEARATADRDRPAEAPKPDSRASRTPPAAGTDKKLSFKERRELEALEAEIPRLEARFAELQTSMSAAANDYARLRALSEEHAALSARIEESMARWETLATRAQQFLG